MFPILLEAYDNPLPNEMDWVLEGFLKIVDNLTGKDYTMIGECAREQLQASKTSTIKRAEKILKKMDFE